MSLLSRGAAVAEVVFRRQVLMSLEIPSKDYAYQWVMQWMDAAGRQTAAFDFIPSPGRHWVRWRGNFILVDRARETKTVDMSTGAPWETLTLTALSIRPNVFQDILAEAKQAALEREEGMTIIYQPFGNPKRIRPFDSVVLDSGVSNHVFDDIQDFLQSHKWYLDRGIPYRRGYLLHGPPGCGKSSFVSALAGRLGYNICVLNLGDPSMTDDRLAHMLAVVPPRCLVLLEDVDFAVGQQTPADPSGPYAGVTRVSFSGLLNALDGVIATEERVVFMTTNHFHALPRALVRPGRVDLSIYIGLASRSQLKMMYLRFFPGQEDLSETFATDEGLSMAELQGYFMFFKNKPEEAVANIKEWLDERRKVHEDRSGLVQQALNAAAYAAGVAGASVAPKLPCWADFRGTNLQDEGVEKLLHCLSSMPLLVERLYLASNSITPRSMTVLREFLQQGHLRALDLAHNSLDDESSFSLLTSLTETETTETTETKVAPSAPAPLSVFLGENFVRNPPALLERLRRVGLRVKLDEVKISVKALPSLQNYIIEEVQLTLSTMGLETAGLEVDLQAPGDLPKIHLKVPSSGGTAGDFDATFSDSNCEGCIPPSESFGAYRGKSALGDWILTFQDPPETTRSGFVAWVSLALRLNC
eukprot:g19743.t1